MSEAQVFNVDTIRFNGNPNNRINLLIMGDGYTAGQMSTFRSDARQVANYFFSIPPFSKYQNFFNVFGIEVVSNESGNDHPETASDCVIGAVPITSVDNYLSTTFDYGGTHRCIYSNQSSLVYSVANDNVPLYDYINVIVNTSYYGGCAGGIAYTSMNSSSPEVFVHEFGHMFGNLSDEYDYGSSSCSAGSSQTINCTQVTDPNTIVWKNWLTTAPLPTPSGTNCNLIGAYEGAKYCSSNWYRPKCDCKMRSLNEPFCEVCYEQLIYKVSTMVNYIQSFTPSNSTTLSLCKNATMNFTADVLNSSDNTVRSQWLVDNVLVQNNGSNFTLNPSALSLGIHTVKLLTYDTTVAVKKTMNSYQVSWTVNVLAAPSATAGSNGTTFCTGQNLNLNASGVGTYSWTGPNAYTSTTQNPTIVGLDSTRTGTYTVTTTNSCGTSSSSVSISVSSSINTSVAPLGPTTFCSGESVVLDAGANTNYSYQWHDSSGAIAGATSHEYTVFQSGTYTVHVSINSTSCSAVSAPISVTVNPMPSAVISASDTTTFCEGDSALLSAQTGAGYTYQWFRNNQVLSQAVNSQLTALSTGNYHVVSSLGACKDTSADINILVHPVPSNAVTITGDTIFCDGDVVNLSVPVCGNCVYQWKKNLIDISGATSDSINVTESGSFSVEITNSTTQCKSGSRVVDIDVHQIPLATITASGPLTFCSGDSLLLSAPSVSTYSYIWYRDSQILVGQSNSDVIVSSAGTYKVEVSDNLCSATSDTVQLIVQPSPVATIDPLPDTLCIYNSIVNLSASPFGGVFTGDGVIDSTFNPSLAGAGLHNISYHYSDSNGCTDVSVTTVFVDICLGTKEINKEYDFILYPNPASGMVQIYYSTKDDQEVCFSLSDLTGRVIKFIRIKERTADPNVISLNTDDLSTGVYFVEMNKGDYVSSKKLLISK